MNTQSFSCLLRSPWIFAGFFLSGIGFAQTGGSLPPGTETLSIRVDIIGLQEEAAPSESEPSFPQPSLDPEDSLLLDFSYDQTIRGQFTPSGFLFPGALRQVDIYRVYGDRYYQFDQANGAFDAEFNFLTNQIIFQVPSTLGGINIRLMLQGGLVRLEGDRLSPPQDTTASITLELGSPPATPTRNGWDVLLENPSGAPLGPIPDAIFFATLPELIADLEAELATAISGREEALNNLSQAQADLQTARDDIDSLVAENTTLQALLDQALSDLVTANATIAELQSEIQTLTAANADLENELADKLEALAAAQVSLQMAEENISQLQEEKAQLELALSGALNDLASANAEFLALQAENDGLESTLAEALAELEAADTQILQLQGELEAVTAELVTTQETLVIAEGTILELRLQVTQLLGENSSLESALDQARSELAQTEAELVAANGEVSTLSVALSSSQEALAAALGDIASLEETLSSQVANIASLQNQVANLENTLVDATQEISVLQSTLVSLEAANLVLSSTNTALQNELEVANDRIAQLEAGAGNDPDLTKVLSEVETALARALYRSSYSIPGDTPEEQLDNLGRSISELNRGVLRMLYVNLVGRESYRTAWKKRIYYRLKKSRFARR